MIRSLFCRSIHSLIVLLALMPLGCGTAVGGSHFLGVPTAASPNRVDSTSSVNEAYSMNPPPNIQFNVNIQSGHCPETVGIWLLSLGMEGGADHTVIADTYAIASMAQIAQSDAKRIVYSAPLQEEYASCIAEATSEWLGMYRFQFQDGTVGFEWDVSGYDGYHEVLYSGISANRPYLHWRAAE